MDSTPPQTNLLADLWALIEQRNEAAEAFDIFKQDAVMSSAPDIAPAGVSSADAAAAAAEEVDSFTSETEGLMASATDDELLVAYQHAGGEVGDLAVETLLAEIRRRSLDE